MVVTPQDIKSRLDAGENLRLIDVREPDEHRKARIDGAQLIPMGTVPGALEQLRSEPDPIIVFCHHGIRSLQVVNWLKQRGVENCASMDGGIDRWSVEIDASIPRYR